jgi:hypothetical protein
LFADGSSGAMWFAGTIVESWVNGNFISETDIEQKRDMILNHQIDMMKLAVRNFHQFFWVGLLDEAKSSLDLLSFQLGLDLDISDGLPVLNSNEHQKATDIERLVIGLANPMDMALYEYISKIQYARMKMYQDHINYGNAMVLCDEGDIDTFSYPFYFNGTQIW